MVAVAAVEPKVRELLEAQAAQAAVVKVDSPVQVAQVQTRRSILAVAAVALDLTGQSIQAVADQV